MYTHGNQNKNVLTVVAFIQTLLKEWYGILGFNVPLDTVLGHFGDGGP